MEYICVNDVMHVFVSVLHAVTFPKQVMQTFCVPAGWVWAAGLRRGHSGGILHGRPSLSRIRDRPEIYYISVCFAFHGSHNLKPVSLVSLRLTRPRYHGLVEIAISTRVKAAYPKNPPPAEIDNSV